MTAKRRRSDPVRPWEDEPDRKQWTESGYPCLIVRVPKIGHLCGYAGVDDTHPAYGLDVDADRVRQLDVHGGITFADHGATLPAVQQPSLQDRWFFGFDAAHHTDRMPVLETELSSEALRALPGTYKDMDFMAREVRRLVSQLEAFRS